MDDRNKSRCCNTELLNNYLAEEDKRAERLEDFQQLIESRLDDIEDLITSIKNVAESFPDLDLDDEIKNSILEML